MTTAAIFCTFTVGIDELPRRKQRNPVIVGRILASEGRFSVFEATANRDIARTMDKLQSNGWFDFGDGQFPWTTVRVTDAGKRALARSLGKRVKHG